MFSLTFPVIWEETQNSLTALRTTAAVLLTCGQVLHEEQERKSETMSL